MSIDFTPWPEALARRYRERGYWTDRPLTDIITRQAKNDAVALIDPQCSL
ncbi:MAG: hypothetical protein WCD24_25810, partial [Serratia inhibens]